MKPIEIRRLKAGDAKSLWSMLAPAFRAGDTYTIDPGISEQDAVAYWTSPEKTTFLAVGKQPLGTYYIKANQQGGGTHVCNCGFVTDFAARGQGVASAMLHHALATARDRGYRAMQFNFVVATNEGAIRLWERAGFDTVGRLPAAFLHPRRGYVDALVMYKSLLEA